MENKMITEEMHVEKEWFEQARKQTIETLPDFMNHVMGDYVHDYGTICHAVSACAMAAIFAADNHENGGITGFQAGFVMWDIIRQLNFRSNKCGMKLVDYDDMLYPQYESRYDKTISPDIWKSLQESAKDKIKEDEEDGGFASPRVVQHWKSIVNGTVPFGYKVKED